MAAPSSSSSSASTSEWHLITYQSVSHDGDLLSAPLRSHAAKEYFSQVAQHYASHSKTSNADLLPAILKPSSSSSVSPLECLEVAVAALNAFVQLNWTGPELSSDSLQPGSLLRWAEPSAFAPRSLDGGDGSDALDTALKSSALEALTWQGEPAYHLCRHAFFLTLATAIIDGLSGDQVASQQLLSLPWWKLRVAMVHNRILDEPVALPRSILDQVDRLLAQLAARGPQAAQLHARLLVERGLALSKTGSDKEANDYFVQAASATGLRYELSGALGKKTKYQQEEKTILVVLAESSEEAKKAEEEEQGSKDGKASNGATPAASSSSAEAAPTGWKSAPSTSSSTDLPTNYELNDDTLLEQTRFTSNASPSSAVSARDPNSQPALTPLDQSILLALSLFHTNTSPTHGLTTSQISAFVSRVALHPRNWSVYTMALLLRSRLEATRTRTAERAVLQLQALLDQMPSTDSAPRERLRFFFQLDLPSKWEMQAELARRYATLGVLRSALEIYERIEMWEDVVACLGALGRQEEGIEVVRSLLEGGRREVGEVLASKKASSSSDRLTRARRAKLWCLLGDLEPEKSKSHYLTAWRTSGSSSSRAARSLGGLYFSLTQYSRATLWLRRALRLSSLMGRTWFMLGCCYLRSEAWGRAARCFRRCTAVDEEDGEAWNNLASCYLRMAGEVEAGGERGGQVTREELEGDEVEEGEASGGEGEEDEDADDAASTTSSMQTATTADSGVALTARGSEAGDDDDEAGNRPSSPPAAPRTILTPYILKILSQRCLRHSLRHSSDSWRVWSNYMVVSVDVGDVSEACRAFAQVVKLKAKQDGGRVRDAEEEIDWAVLRKLVDVAAGEERDKKSKEASTTAAGVAPPTTAGANGTSSYLDLVSAPLTAPTAAQENSSGPANGSPSFLSTSLLSLLTTTLPPLLPTPPPASLPFILARLHLATRAPSQAITAYLEAFRCVVPPTAPACAEREHWQKACAAAVEMCENVSAVAGQLDDDEEESRAKRKAKSALKGFMARQKSAWEGEQGWAELEKWLDELA
ncbi:TPR-like protein [Jaminaea rosea]|uniref:TPR-like protein n=1 Tax=Jaminaea rosea TaxID=1569628 RepID=A0A316UGL3_9BASI|nr:TPR-like protein [Jaminaea rosea]PWN24402.1 TPR-like protein [Jaminaea rosea]